MRRRGAALEERRLQELLARLAHRVSPPTEDELSELARSISRAPRTAVPKSRRRPVRVRWALARAGACLVVGGSGGNSDAGPVVREFLERAPRAW